MPVLHGVAAYAADELRAAEPELRQCLMRELKRGKVDCTISLRSAQGAQNALELDAEALALGAAHATVRLDQATGADALSRIIGEAGGKVTLFIADFYNERVRAVGPDGIIRDLSDEGREAFGAPTRVAFDPRRGFLYVADSTRDRVVPLIIPKIAPNLVPPRPVLPPRRIGG